MYKAVASAMVHSTPLDRLIDNVNLYSASIYKKTSNAPCAVVEGEQN